MAELDMEQFKMKVKEDYKNLLAFANPLFYSVD